MDTADLSLGYKNIPTRVSKTPNRKPLFPSSKKGKSVSGRSTQSTQVICKTLLHTVESYGTPVPVQITEALAFSDRNVTCSASVSSDGWAWFIIGRRLLIWQVIAGKQTFGSTCRELNLPPSDLTYSSNLVSVFGTHGNQTVSCLVVSPEGVIRYWPNISNEGVSIEHNCDLQGQECETVLHAPPIGFVMATTTATILLIETRNIGGRFTIHCRSLSAAGGWLGGIGKKVSSMLFGGLQTSQNAEVKLIRILTAANYTPGNVHNVNSYNIYALVNRTFQSWSLTTGEQEKLVYECDLEPLIVENFQQTVGSSYDGAGIEVYLLDMYLLESSPRSIVILAAAYNNSSSNLPHYALVSLSVDGSVAPVRTSSFNLLKNVDFTMFQPDSNLKKVYLLVSGQTVYMYNHRYIVSSALNGFDETDVIDLPDTSILGGTVVNRLPVFFSRMHGFVSLSQFDMITPFDLVNNSSVPNLDLSGMTEFQTSVNDTGIEDVTMYKDSNACLKASFLFYVSKKVGQARAMINDMFPLTESIPQVDSTLDLVVVRVSVDLINDVPARDPRWAEMKSEKINLNSTVSLQIQNQLEEKQQALDWYISFLKEMGLWNRLQAVRWNDVIMGTTYVFAEMAEKLIAAVTLKKLQNKYANIIEPVIKEVVNSNDLVPTGGLTAFDLFYRQVSHVNKALTRLCKWCEEYASTSHNIQDTCRTISDVNSILLSVLEEISQFRQEKGVVFMSDPKLMTGFNVEMLSWTATSGEKGLKDALILQADLTLNYGIKSTNIMSQRQELLNQLMAIDGIILEGLKIHVDSVHDRSSRHEELIHQFENERLALLEPLYDIEEYDAVSTLAEKYCDFTMLIRVCDKTDDEARLGYYMEKYEKQDFSQFLFSWYIREKKQGKLLSQFRGNKRHQHALNKFLSEHPSLAWLHAVFSGNYEQAAETLLKLAFEEMTLMKRRKCMLSLGKLALLASTNSDGHLFEKVNREIDYLAYQEDLPDAVLAAFGFDFETMRVLLPPELVKLYVADENTTATELDFAKALDILHFVNDKTELHELTREIWCKAITHDTWPSEDANIEDPIAYLDRFLFFKTIRFGLERDDSLLVKLPPLEKLLSFEDVGDLRHNKTFQYLMQIGYEYYIKQAVPAISY